MTVYLTAEKISKSYSEKTLLQEVSLTVNEGDRIGIVGVNGTGKSTLLKILAGEDTPDTGAVTRMTGLRTAYLPQNPEFTQGLSVLRQTMLHAAAGDSAEYECRALLTRLGLRDLDRDVSLLSAGRKSAPPWPPPSPGMPSCFSSTSLPTTLIWTPFSGWRTSLRNSTGPS